MQQLQTYHRLTDFSYTIKTWSVCNVFLKNSHLVYLSQGCNWLVGIKHVSSLEAISELHVAAWRSRFLVFFYRGQPKAGTGHKNSFLFFNISFPGPCFPQWKNRCQDSNFTCWDVQCIAGLVEFFIRHFQKNMMQWKAFKTKIITFGGRIKVNIYQNYLTSISCKM